MEGIRREYQVNLEELLAESLVTDHVLDEGQRPRVWVVPQSIYVDNAIELINYGIAMGYIPASPTGDLFIPGNIKHVRFVSTVKAPGTDKETREER